MRGPTLHAIIYCKVVVHLIKYLSNYHFVISYKMFTLLYQG